MRERFGLFTLNFAEFVKGFVEASKKKTYYLKTQSDAGFAIKRHSVCRQAGNTCRRQNLTVNTIVECFYLR